MNRKYESFASKKAFEKVVTTAFHMSLPGPSSDWNREFDIYEWDTYLPILYKDISKISFDYENCDFVYSNIKDFHYQVWSVGGDWEYPVIFIVYWDGANIRGYVPKEGNCYNWKTKQAIGNSSEADIKFLQRLFKTKIEDESLAELMYDDEALKEDIKKRFGL